MLTKRPDFDLSPTFIVGRPSALAERRAHAVLKMLLWGMVGALSVIAGVTAYADHAHAAYPTSLHASSPYWMFAADCGGEQHNDSDPTGNSSSGYPDVALGGLVGCSTHTYFLACSNASDITPHSSASYGTMWGFPLGSVPGTCTEYYEDGVLVGGTALTPPAPEGDSNPASHVMRFTSPVLYATTTSPVAVSFDYNIGSTTVNGQGAFGYQLYFVNLQSGYTKTVNALLTDYTDGPHTQTASVSLAQNGTYRLDAYLTTNDGLPNPIVRFTSGGLSTYFGIDYNDDFTNNTQEHAVLVNPYASSSCAIDFTGSFNFGDCLGYLIIPTSGSSSPSEGFKELTLANSFPFAYAYQIGDLRNELFNSSSTATTTIGVTVGSSTSAWHITFLSKEMIAAIPLSGYVKTVLGWLLWFMLAELIYYQVIRVHDQNTPHN